MLKRLLVFVPLSLLCSMCGVFCEGGLLGGIEAHAALIQLPQTGQTTCYDAAGSAVSCSSTGQDGDKQAGVAWNDATRFTDNHDGTITDTLTGLVWLQNADCRETAGGVAKPSGVLNWADALAWSNSLATGNCGLTDGSTAGQWRLPTRKEIKSIINRGEVDNDVWLGTKGFNVILLGNYWSSSTYANSANFAGYAWYVDINDGFVDFFVKSTLNNVWPVRGGQ
jgi:hypothetical protein